MGELEVLYQALASPLGLVIKTDNVQLALQRLYKARKSSGDPDLAVLQFRRNPRNPTEEIWILKQKDLGTP